MKDNRLDYLLDRYLARETTPDELIEFEELLQAEEKTAFTRTIAEKMQHDPPASIDDIDKWDRMLQHILAVDKPALQESTLEKPGLIKPILENPALDEPKITKKTIPLFRWVATAAAAAIIIFATVSTWRWLDRTSQPFDKDAFDIAHNNVSTGRYNQRDITLPDSTHIWLAPESSISFPVAFDNEHRTLYLTGKAFFDVRRKGSIPFRVQTDHAITTVLGTSFDINAYPNKQVTISIQTGKVKVESATKTLAILEKGTQLRLSNDSTVKQTSIDPQQIAAWRSGTMSYRDETLEDIVEDMRRNFNDTIAIKTSVLKKIKVTISFNKWAGTKEALDLLTHTTESNLIYQNGTYIIE